jgi:hypothetical protein
MAQPKPTSPPPAVKPGELPPPDQVRPMPSEVMNWEKKSLDGSPASADSRHGHGRKQRRA